MANTLPISLSYWNTNRLLEHVIHMDIVWLLQQNYPSGDVIFSLCDFWLILLNQSTCRISHAFQSIHMSWKMKELLLVINISFYLEKIDNVLKLLHHFWGEFIEITRIPLYQLYIYLKLPSLFTAWPFWTFHTKSHNMKALVILSHSWSPFLPLTCLYGKREPLWVSVQPSGVFSWRNTPPRLPIQIT